MAHPTMSNEQLTEKVHELEERLNDADKKKSTAKKPAAKKS